MLYTSMSCGIGLRPDCQKLRDLVLVPVASKVRAHTLFHGPIEDRTHITITVFRI